MPVKLKVILLSIFFVSFLSCHEGKNNPVRGTQVVSQKFSAKVNGQYWSATDKHALLLKDGTVNIVGTMDLISLEIKISDAEVGKFANVYSSILFINPKYLYDSELYETYSGYCNITKLTDDRVEGDFNYSCRGNNVSDGKFVLDLE